MARFAFLFFLLSSTISSFAQSHPLGVLWENDRYNALPVKQVYGKVTDLPAHNSLESRLPRIINQASNNNAVGWILGWYGLTLLEARNNDLTDINAITDHALNPAFPYWYGHQKRGGCLQTSSMIDALESMVNYGTPLFSSYSGPCGDSVATKFITQASGHRLSGYVRLFNTFDPVTLKVNAVKQALAEDNPVAAGIICPPSFLLAKEFWEPHEDPETGPAGHAILVVGYNDEQYGGAFEVVNTWGSSWGDGGRTWLLYKDFAAFAQYGFELYLNDKPIRGVVQFEDDQEHVLEVEAVDQPGLYRFSSKMKTGDKIRLQFATENDVFANLFFVDARGGVTPLFPDGNTVFPKPQNNALVLPGVAQFYTLSPPAGTGYFVVVMAKDMFSLNAASSAVQRQGVPPSLVAYNEGITFSQDAVRFAEKDASVRSAMLVIAVDQR